MQSFSINQKPNGQHLRVTVEHKPLQIDPLIQLQQYIQSKLTEFTPKDSPYIHLTLLHLGIPQDIYYEFRKLHPNLTQEEFMAKFFNLLTSLHQFTLQNSGQITVQADKIALYGSAKSPAVALKINRNASIDQLHFGIFSILIDWVASNIPNNAMSFIQSSRNFRHSPPKAFDPHITLGRISQIQLSMPQLSESLNVTLDKPYLAHVTLI